MSRSEPIPGPERRSSEETTQPLRSVFGFDLDEPRWLERLRRSSETGTAGPGRLGEYELLEAVGRGGQGVVYRARQPRTGREIVIKRLSAGVFATPEMHARFAREVEAAAALDHPYIVTVYGSEVIEDQPVLVMQWIDGLPFDRWAAGATGGRRDVREVLGVFARVCEAVHHAHQRGVIHRDLKPSNILVDRLDMPHVLDFGLAKLRSESLDHALTQSGVFVGTPAYAAPEQALGQHREIDVRTDVYALGALLYQALCGVMAFDPSQELPRLLHAIQHREPRAPSAVDGRNSREIDAIVLKALAKDKEQRYTSSEALRADVESYLAGRAVLAHPPSASYRLRKLARRHKVGVAVGLTFLLLVLAATAVSTVLYFHAETARKRMTAALAAESQRLTEVLAEQERSRHSYLRAHGAELLMGSLFEKSLRGAQGGVGVLTIREVLDLLSADMAESNAPPEAAAWMHMSIGNAYASLGLQARARPHFERALALRSELFGGVHIDVAESMDRLGRACRLLRDHETAELMLEGALDIRRKLLPWNDPHFSTSTNSLGILKRHRGKFLEAEALLVESLGHYQRLYGPKSDSVPVVMKNLGLVYVDLDRPADGADLMRAALPLALELHGERHMDTASVQLNLATALERLGEHGEAEELLARAGETLMSLYGDRNATLALVHERRAEVCRETARPAEAERWLELAIEIHRVVGNRGEVVRCLGRLAELLQGMQRLAEAEAALREALCIACEMEGASHETIGIQQAALAEHLAGRGMLDEAEGLLRTAEPVLAALSSEERAGAARRALARLAEQRDGAAAGNEALSR